MRKLFDAIKLVDTIKQWLINKTIGAVACYTILLFVILILVVPFLYIAYVENYYQFRDRDEQRGAAIVAEDTFGDKIEKIKYLEQGWKPAQSLWFYTTSQGSDLLPYDLFMEVEQIGKTDLFRDNKNINRYRYLPQNITPSNPDGLPVGLVKDNFQGRDYLGYSCAACHTGQVNYKGTGMRIDGGPAGADFDTFIRDLAAAMRATESNIDVRDRFIKRVLARGNYDSAQQVIDALKLANQKFTTYNTINESATAYGYARLDAFGRIYNRVLEHILTGKQIRELLDGVLTKQQLDAALGDTTNIINGAQRDSVFGMLSESQLKTVKAKMTNSPNAPVSYPFLWDIPQHDYVQWNGLAANAALGSVGRNTGEVIGVFGTLDWKKDNNLSLTSLINGDGFKTHVSFQSSIRVHNLRRIESQLWDLQSPQWPEDILPPINKERAARGEPIFDQFCAGCHAEIERTDPQRRVVAHMSSIDRVGTDPQMAQNSINYSGLSGILRNEYSATTSIGNILLNEKAPAAALLTKATRSVVATPYPYQNRLQGFINWAYDIGYVLLINEIKESIKTGNYNPDTSVKPFASLLSYKARSLNGIWATAPYLHNGSVPTLYALLLPKKRAGDPDDGEYRPDTFVVGSRELDPDKVGITSSGYDGFVFDSSLPGNSNAGHEYASGRTAQADGKVLPPLSKEQRLDLLEYLKTL